MEIQIHIFIFPIAIQKITYTIYIRFLNGKFEKDLDFFSNQNDKIC